MKHLQNTGRELLLTTNNDGPSTSGSNMMTSTRKHTGLAAPSFFYVTLFLMKQSHVALLTMAGQLDNDTDSTMLHVQMQPGVLPAVASLQGRPFRISFDLGANARLYSFWFSSSAAGHSGGWLGAGGPRYARGLQDL